MSQFNFKINVGNMEITINEEYETHQEFVKKLSFFSSLPSKGPNGEEDLKFVARTTQQGHEYYSIVSESAKKEYKFGQSQKEKGTMYGKGWEDLFTGQETQQAAPVQQTQVQQAPVPQPTPAPQVTAAPVPTPRPQVMQAPEPMPAPTAQIPNQVQNQAPAAPANNAAINAVLQKYGIQNQQ